MLNWREDCGDITEVSGVFTWLMGHIGGPLSRILLQAEEEVRTKSVWMFSCLYYLQIDLSIHLSVYRQLLSAFFIFSEVRIQQQQTKQGIQDFSRTTVSTSYWDIARCPQAK